MGKSRTEANLLADLDAWASGIGGDAPRIE
jgi:hypothetical protein